MQIDTQYELYRLLLVEYAIHCYSNGANEQTYMADVKTRKSLNLSAWHQAMDLIKIRGLNAARDHILALIEVSQ